MVSRVYCKYSTTDLSRMCDTYPSFSTYILIRAASTLCSKTSQHQRQLKRSLHVNAYATIAARTPARPATPHAWTDEAALPVLEGTVEPAVPEAVPVVVPDAEAEDAEAEDAEAAAELAAFEAVDAADAAEDAAEDAELTVSPKRLASPTMPPWTLLGVEEPLVLTAADWYESTESLPGLMTPTMPSWQ